MCGLLASRQICMDSEGSHTFYAKRLAIRTCTPLVVHVETVRMSQLLLGRLIIRQVSIDPFGVPHGCCDCSDSPGGEGDPITSLRL